MATPLIDALRELELDAEVSLGGRWAELRGERCLVYVVEVAVADGYFTWCGDPLERAVEFYRSPAQAIEVGLQRATASSKDSVGARSRVASRGHTRPTPHRREEGRL